MKNTSSNSRLFSPEGGEKQPSAGEHPVKSILKALNALDILSLQDVRREGVGLFDLSRQLGVRPNTLHNILKTMALCGYVAQNREGRYMAGPKCDQISAVGRLISGNILNGIVEPALQSLGKRLGETVVFTLLSNGRRYQLLVIEADNPVRVAVQDGGYSIYELVPGRLLVAFAGSEARRLIAEHYGYPGKAWGGAEDMDALDALCRQVREQPFLQMRSLSGELDTFGLPLLIGEEPLVSSIGVFLPSYRSTPQRREEICSAMKAAREEILQKL